MFKFQNPLYAIGKNYENRTLYQLFGPLNWLSDINHTDYQHYYFYRKSISNVGIAVLRCPNRNRLVGAKSTRCPVLTHPHPRLLGLARRKSAKRHLKEIISPIMITTLPNELLVEVLWTAHPLSVINSRLVCARIHFELILQ